MMVTAAESPKTFFAKKTKPAGEPLVWFTGMGLSLGLMMIVSLLALILVKGLEVFWPAKIMVLQLKEGSEARLEGADVLAGALVMKQEKPVRVLDAPEDHDHTEWQLFVGNKDVYGFSYKFVDAADVESVSYPRELIRIERLEYGDALAEPRTLKMKNGEIYPATHPEFRERLRELVEEASARWKKIRAIEKVEIGSINRKMEKIRLHKRALTSRGFDAESPEIQSLDDKTEALQKKYEVLAAEAGVLRQKQTQDVLIYRTLTDQEKILPVGNIVDFYYPNQLSFLDRIGVFFHKIAVFLSEEPREANTEGGVFPAIFGTFVMTVMMSVAVTPFGVLAAIYLREYAKQGFMVRCVRIAVNNLAGVPSIVFGVFGVGFFVYFVGAGIDSLFFKEALPTPTFGTGGILWSSLTLALLTVPVVIVATEEALASVPRGMREGSLACGASKWETIYRIVLPASAPGILTGLILAMARGASEVAPLMLVGVVKLAPSLPLDGVAPFFHLERKFMHLGFHIYDLGFQSPDSEAAKPMVFATTLLLITLVVILNLGAIFIREKLRKKYATGAF